MKKDILSNNVSAITHRSISNRDYQNRIIYKCKKQRSNLIYNSVSNLIKKQLTILTINKKIQKQLQQNQKDIIYIPEVSPIDRVNKFRYQQKQKQWEQLKNYQIKKQSRMKLLENSMKQKSISQQARSSENINRMNKVHRRFQERQKEIQNSNLENGARLTTRFNQSMTNMNKSGISFNNSHNASHNQSQNHFSNNSSTISNRISTANNKIASKQLKNINNFLTKMKIIQQRKIKKQLQAAMKRTQTAKILPKCTIAKRIGQQQSQMNKWSEAYEQRFRKFQQNKAILQQEKIHALQEKSMHQMQNRNQILNRKHQNQQKISTQRISSLLEKLNKINTIPNRQQKQKYCELSKQNFHHNDQKCKEDWQKQQHSTIMRKIAVILEKLNKMGDNQKLKQWEIQFLIENIGLAQSQGEQGNNSQGIKEIYRYLNSTKEKFFQHKRKE